MANPSKKRGTAWETAVCGYLRWALGDDRIQRLTLHGSKDVGDIGNVHLRGRRVVIECKATRRAAYSAHWGETTVEMGNANADLGAVVWKRPGHGVDTLEKMRAHLAYMGEDVWKRMLELSGVDPRRIETLAIPRNPDLVGLPLDSLALLLNHGLPLGPETIG